MIASVVGEMVRKSRLLSVKASRSCDTRMMEDGSFVEGTNGPWLIQVML